MRCISFLITVFSVAVLPGYVTAADHVANLQKQAIMDGKAEFAHWGVDPSNYTEWRTHSNRLIPVYTFGTKGQGEGIDLNSWTGSNSPYRSEAALRTIYSRLPEQTMQPKATWMDQTNIADLQRSAIAAGRKYVFLVVFDGMDWQTTRAASIHNQQAITYHQGRGTGTFLQEYTAAGTSQYGFMVTSPHNNGTKTDPTKQTVLNPGGNGFGGYDATRAGFTPWDTNASLNYLIGKSDGPGKHVYTDSASSATSMTAGLKTYNNAISVDVQGNPVVTIAHEVQQQGWAVGAVSSVPISHATPASAYAHNVSRKDYQDISRDMLGLPSVSHPKKPMPGMDVVLGGGFGSVADTGKSQGDNFEPGNVYLADSDLLNVSVNNGGRYVTAVRTPGKIGAEVLKQAAQKAATDGHRLLGFYGVGKYNGHLPFQTADGGYDPVPGNSKKAEVYSEQDIQENVTLQQMTEAAIQVLQSRNRPFWLMVEAGDVDWANHDNNLDNSIGAVNSGDAAVRSIAEWVEAHSNWNESLMIVTADHGHLLNLVQPEALIAPSTAD